MDNSVDSSSIFLEKGLRKRQSKTLNVKKNGNWQPRVDDDWDDNLPYGGKVYLARQKKPDSLLMTCIEVFAVIFAFGLAYYSYYYFDHLHYHVTYGYAYLGYPEAQRVIGDKLHHGHGVEQNQHRAMEWYKLASDQGHPHASYNLAVGHLKGIRKDLLEKGDPHRLIVHAADNGVEEAKVVLHELCIHGRCED